MINFGLSVFQSRDVKGAVCSGVLELERRARGCNFCGAGSRELADADRLILLLVICDADVCGKLHNRKWSPLVASRSVLCF